MPVVSSAIIGGLTGLGFALALWTRKEEIDSEGNVCLRYFGPKYAIPMTIAFWVFVGIKHIDDPLYLRNPENFFVILGFVAISLLASLHFVFYRITLTENFIERFQWPLRPRRYPLNELSFIGEKGRQTVLHFSGGKALKIQLLLSGQVKFLERLQAFLLSQAGKKSFRPHIGHGKGSS